MRKERMSLEDFLKFGGKFQKFPVDKSYSTYYGGDNYLQNINQIHQNGLNNQNEPLYDVTFQDNSTARLSGCWIEAEINLKLDDIYTK